MELLSKIIERSNTNNITSLNPLHMIMEPTILMDDIQKISLNKECYVLELELTFKEFEKINGQPLKIQTNKNIIILNKYDQLLEPNKVNTSYSLSDIKTSFLCHLYVHKILILNL